MATTSTQLPCPSCNKNLSQIIAESVQVDICNSGCGGIWFDKTELERFDEPKVFLPPQLFQVIPNALVAIDRNKTRSCPRCSNQVLQQQLQSDTLGIEVIVAYAVAEYGWTLQRSIQSAMTRRR